MDLHQLDLLRKQQIILYVTKTVQLIEEGDKIYSKKVLKLAFREDEDFCCCKKRDKTNREKNSLSKIRSHKTLSLCH
jgi:hypothetical protein